MKHNDLPDRWKLKIKEYLSSIGKSEYNQLSANEFNGNSVLIEFPDESIVLFKYAFVIKVPDWNEVAVFTEHCGYHLFPFADLKISITEEDNDNIFYKDYPHFTIKGNQWGEEGYVFYDGKVFDYYLDRKDQFDKTYNPRSISQFLTFAKKKKLEIPDTFLQVLTDYKDKG